MGHARQRPAQGWLAALPGGCWRDSESHACPSSWDGDEGQTLAGASAGLGARTAFPAGVGVPVGGAGASPDGLLGRRAQSEGQEVTPHRLGRAPGERTCPARGQEGVWFGGRLSPLQVPQARPARLVPGGRAGSAAPALAALVCTSQWAHGQCCPSPAILNHLGEPSPLSPRTEELQRA